MLYDIDIFGYVPGYITKNWQVMSEQDLLTDKRLARRLYETRYQIWKRTNISELTDEYERANQSYELFERFCRKMFRFMGPNSTNFH